MAQAIDVVILFFLFGLVAGWLRSELKLPGGFYDGLTLLLLLAIGLKGGQYLADVALVSVLPHVAAVIVFCIVQTLIGFVVLRYGFALDRPNAAAVAAHYGSVSVATFAVASAWLSSRGIPFEGHMVVLLALMELPAIIVGVFLAKGVSRDTRWSLVMHEAFLSKGVTLLIGGLAIGWIAGPQGLAPIAPLFQEWFKPLLALFLLEMGLVVSRQMAEIRRRGVAIVVFALAMPLSSAVAATLIGHALGLSLGGTVMLATLAASASYIAVPAAFRLVVPEANPGVALAGALGVTFPFNVLVGIPLYHALAKLWFGWMS